MLSVVFVRKLKQLERSSGLSFFHSTQHTLLGVNCAYGEEQDAYLRKAIEASYVRHFLGANCAFGTNFQKNTNKSSLHSKDSVLCPH